jgi:hypothetical protein
MTWLSNPGIPTRSSPILKRLSHLYESTSGSSTPISGSVDGVYSYQTSIGLASGQVPRRSQADKSPIVVKGPFFP